MRRDLNDWLSCRTNSAVCGRPTGHRRACGEFVSISGSKPQQKEVALEWADARNMHDFFFFFFQCYISQCIQTENVDQLAARQRKAVEMIIGSPLYLCFLFNGKNEQRCVLRTSCLIALRKLNVPV